MRDVRHQGGWMGKAVVVLLVWVVLAGAAYYLLVVLPNGGAGAPTGASPGAAEAPKPVEPATAQVTVGIAYGTEKRDWLQRAVAAFEQTEAGQRIDIDLMGLGSLESANAILDGNEKIHVWSPASALYRRVFTDEWELRHGRDPIVRGQELALTPMVFVMWQPRYEAFVQHYRQLSFQTLSEALAEPGGWDAIANRPDWGLFKFGHTHPNQSNSGLMTLVLLAYDYHGKLQDLALKDILDPEFHAWMTKLEKAVSGLPHSTGTMMRDMVLRGPSTFDVVMVYENLAIDELKSAQGRWGDIQVIYPPENVWNDNPYYILDVPWSDEAHRTAAAEFLDFLMTEPIQRMALEHGFRPGNPDVPVRFPESPFVKYASYGLQIDVPAVVEFPPPEVINNLLATWQRSVGR